MALTDDLRTTAPLKWGILGPGWIAHEFVQAVQSTTRQQIVAVGSRSADRADVFASRHSIPTTHDSYEALVADPQVEVVLVATPHSEHRDHALLAIAAGKHVLVEKSFTRNAAEAEEVFAAARAAGVFVMEAMWTRFLPHIREIRRIIDSGDLGEIIAVEADHGQYFPFDPEHRLFAPALAGGALLDLGVYPVSFAHFVLGTPVGITALGQHTETGVDGQVSALLDYGDRAQAIVSTTLWSRTATRAAIAGSAGRIDIAPDFYRPTSFTFTARSGGQWTYDHPVTRGLQYQAVEVARLVHEGATESPIMPWADTLAVMTTMDEIRRQIGVSYPGE